MQMFVKLPTRRRSVCISSLRSPSVGPRSALDSLQRALIYADLWQTGPGLSRCCPGTHALALSPRWPVVVCDPLRWPPNSAAAGSSRHISHLRIEVHPYDGGAPCESGPTAACVFGAAWAPVGCGVGCQVFPTCNVLVPGLPDAARELNRTRPGPNGPTSRA